MVTALDHWVIFAILAALFGGLHAFTHKIAAERGYASGYFNALSTGCAAIIGIVYVTAYVGWTHAFFLYGFLLCVFSAVFYVLNANTKIDALRYIDSTLYFPLNKTLTVLATAAAGVILFSEQFTNLQFAGFALSLVVPFLLINTHARSTQKNLSRGLFLLTLAAIFSTGATLVNKFAAMSFASPVLFVVLTHVVITAVAFVSGIEQGRRNNTHDRVSSLTTNSSYIALCVIAGAFQFFGFLTNVSSLVTGNLSLAYAIMSLQVVVPVVLSILWYKEHVDLKKASALFVSVVATYLMK